MDKRFSQNTFELASKVNDENSFLNFIGAIADDRLDELRKELEDPSSPYGPGANGWENWSIETFLDAAKAWGEATKNGTSYYDPPDNPWTRAAQIICAGKFYE